MSCLHLGIVGIGGSHCYEFTRIINGDRISGAHVDFYWGIGDSEKERKASKLLSELGAKPVSRWEDMPGKVDAVLVTPYNHVQWNYTLARPFLEAGLPTYVDKLLSYSISEAKCLVAIAKEKEVVLMSDSALRYVSDVLDFRKRREQIGALESGVAAGPGDITRYGHHTIRMMHGVFGSGIEWVSNCRDYEKDVATIRYKDGKTVTLFLHREKVKRGWRFLYFGENEVGHIELDLEDIYRNFVLEIIAVLSGSRPGPTTEELLETVAVAEAMRQSAPTGQRINIEGLLAEQGFDD